ncbi:dTDP-4-keto-6-deoxy-D-glucose epimerase, partial [Enterobacter hormaechei]|nr:dTDP-4-keto-6-deoxy-D-glucose epimerase [Enterobacter hormaechei]
TNYYSPEHERSILWSDSELNIAWPVSHDCSPSLSSKYLAGKAFKDSDY